MKPKLCAVALFALFACSSPEGSDSAAPLLAGSTATLDFSTHRLGSVTLEELVKACQEATQFNFTYDASTQAALQAERVDLPLSHQIRAAEFTELMSQNGFTLRHIGPEPLHVIAVEQHH